MENKINIAELLKNCPTGMELDCLTFDNVFFQELDWSTVFPIICYRINNGIKENMHLTKFGSHFSDNDAKCIIFPKGKTTWEGFQRPFKDGDVVISDKGDIHLLRTKDSSYCAYRERWNGLPKFDKSITTDIKVVRHATEEEKQTLFQAIKENGYTWNEETKTLEELVKPKFKVGDRIRNKHINNGTDVIIDIEGNWYVLSYCDQIYLNFKCQDNYELVPNKFDITTLKPFDSRVLVREGKTDVWQPTFYGFFHKRNKRFYTTMCGTWRMCIPYNEDTKHLTGTTDDCDEYYKNW